MATGTNMDGVETEVAQPTILERTTKSTSKPAVDDDTMSRDGSVPPGLCPDDGSESEGADDDDNNNNGNKDGKKVADQGEQAYQSSSASSSTTSLHEDPSVISTPEAVYTAVPISSELHIIPHSSKGFNWNQDLFLKPHQRRDLGVDDLHNSDACGSSSSGSSSNGAPRDPAIAVHDIQLEEDEAEKILPS
ncbi:hypothetical protein BGZ51_005488 [Haplosporangium sp. Z 767]|nr:hypothetical protein BGZ51_005488 [Haplosporangium sp. Z 767]KAF9196411.1 hypothetical protein BGZ50_000412 [Haplosporangium sp. Z 11]